MNFIDLTGQKFNKLTVLSKDEEKNTNKRIYWKCKCDCGNEILVSADKLKSGHTKSCGCLKREAQRQDLTGKTFGYWKVLSYAYTKDYQSYYNCQCICGIVAIKQGKLLKNGHTTSCGCMKGQTKIKDLTNKKFGSLLVLEKAELKNHKMFWKCKCNCGNITIVHTASLTSGNTKTCGCGKHNKAKSRKDLVGMTFHNLKVLNYAYTKNKNAYWNCICSCGNKLQVSSVNLVWNYVRSCHKCAVRCSSAEKEVVAFVKSIYKGEIIENDRSIIAPKELDVYIPEKNFAIEYNGLYWHSEAQDKGQSYHLNKTKMCMNKGIRLLHIYENEWRDKQDICKSMIASALGVYERKEFARKCEVREVTDRKTVIDFFEQNHIQGAVHKFSLCLGLYKGDELLQAVVFGKQHFGRNGDYELYRMVTKKNIQVLGGFSKLMKHCPYDTVVSYVALRMFDAKGYLVGNWKIEHTSHPSFCITDGINVYSRHLFKKDKCLKLFDNVTEDMTEREMQIKNGYYRLWDCGTYKVRWCRTA